MFHGQFHLPMIITWTTATKGKYCHLIVHMAHMFALLCMYYQSTTECSSEANLGVMGLTELSGDTPTLPPKGELAEKITGKYRALTRMYKGKVVAAPVFVKYDLCETEISVEYSFGLGIQYQGT